MSLSSSNLSISYRAGNETAELQKEYGYSTQTLNKKRQKGYSALWIGRVFPFVRLIEWEVGWRGFWYRIRTYGTSRTLRRVFFAFHYTSTNNLSWCWSVVSIQQLSREQTRQWTNYNVWILSSAHKDRLILVISVAYIVFISVYLCSLAVYYYSDSSVLQSVRHCLYYINIIYRRQHIYIRSSKCKYKTIYFSMLQNYGNNFSSWTLVSSKVVFLVEPFYLDFQ